MSQSIVNTTTYTNIRAIPDFVGGILKICNNLHTATVKTFEDGLQDVFDKFMKSLLREMIAAKTPKNEICKQLGINSRLFDRLYEEICDEDLIMETSARIEEAGGFEAMVKDSYSEEEVMEAWGITEEDIAACEVYD
jgi:hypothetical protein